LVRVVLKKLKKVTIQYKHTILRKRLLY